MKYVINKDLFDKIYLEITSYWVVFSGKWSYNKQFKILKDDK